MESGPVVFVRACGVTKANSDGARFGRQVTAVFFAVFLWGLVLPTPSDGQTSCVSAPAGLVSWWRAEGDATDFSGGNNGTPDPIGTYGAGVVGQAFILPGNSGIGVGPATNLQLQNFTIEAWVQRASATMTSNPDYENLGYFFGFGTGGYGFGIADNGNLFLTDVGVSAIYATNGFITDTGFHHVAVTKNGGDVVFYVDGTERMAASYDPVFTFDSSAAIGMPGTNYVGIYHPQLYGFWGTIDELSIYDRALAPGEVEAIYDAGGYGKCPDLVPVILSQTTNVVGNLGLSVPFSAEVIGVLPFQYQWSFNGTDIEDATNATLVLADVETNQAGTYSLVVSNRFGSATNSIAVLSVNTAPVILSQPESAGRNRWADCDVFGGGLGASAAEIPMVTGWFHCLWPNEFDFYGPSGFRRLGAFGTYSVSVSNISGCVTSRPVTLTPLALSGAAFLNPFDFAPLGVFDPTTNVVVNVASGTMSGGADFTGTNIIQAGTSILVFPFSNFTLNNGVSITFTNEGADTTAVAFLSQRDMTIDGVINADGNPPIPFGWERPETAGQMRIRTRWRWRWRIRLLKEAAVRRTTPTLRHNSQAEALVETGAGVGKLLSRCGGRRGAERFNSRRLDR